MHEASPVAALRVERASKTFPGVQALKSVSLVVPRGAVHALVGENGAGKSTLVKIIAGIYGPDSGRVEVAGRPMTRFTPRDAASAGVALVAQEPEHFADLTALENLFVGSWPAGATPGTVSWAQMERRARAILAQMEAKVELRARMGDLPLVDRQMIQIGRALLQDARVLILDEPTAALGDDEAAALFRLIRSLSDRGVAVIYISHRLEEIFDIAQTVTVLRDGELIDTRPVEDITREELVRLMVGSAAAIECALERTGALDADAESVLELRKAGSTGRFQDITLRVRRGEMLGLAGLAGSGRNELCHALAGALPLTSGEVVINGTQQRLRRPADARRLGIAFVPGDRPGQSLVLPMTVRENITLSSLYELRRGPLTNVRAERELADEYVGRLDIRTPDAEQVVGALSGGNQQKTALARRLAMRPKVLVLEEPTQGVDVGARAEIHVLLHELAAEGMAVVLLSSDLDELLSMSDTVAVMHRGRLVGTLCRAEATKERVLELAFGHGVEVEQQRTQAPRAVAARGRELGLAVFLVLAAVLLAVKSDQFLTSQNFVDMAMNSSYMLIAALGMTMIILTAGIDISVGSMLALCCIAAGLMATRGVPIPLVVLGTLGVGALLGAVNAAGIAFMRLPPIIMTLATLTIFRGLVVHFSGGSWITDLPAAFRWLGIGAIGPLPVPVCVAALATVAAAWTLSRTRFGRSLYAIGNNPAAAEHLGVPMRAVRIGVYIVGGALVGLSALALAPKYTVIQTNTGIGFEMVVITAVVVGGTNIFGGRGTILGTVLGVMLLQIINNGLALLGGSESAYWEKAFQGILVLLAVMTDFLQTRGRRGREVGA